MENTETKSVAILSASPKINEESVSGFLSAAAQRRFEAAGHRAAVIEVGKSLRQKKTAEDFETMRRADALVVVVPLYVFCLPGILMRFLQDYQEYLVSHPSNKAPNVFAVVNCGFPEPEINGEAVRVIGSFSQAIGASFGFGVMLGGGGMLLGARNAPFMKKTLLKLDGLFDLMAQDIASTAPHPREAVSVKMPVGRRFYFMMGNMGWKMSVRRAGLKRKSLYSTPYMP